MNVLVRLLPLTPPPAAPRSRDPQIAEALARLEVAVELRDAAAARRALDSLMTAGPGGMWLLRQMSAAALHVLADTITGPPAG